MVLLQTVVQNRHDNALARDALPPRRNHIHVQSTAPVLWTESNISHVIRQFQFNGRPTRQDDVYQRATLVWSNLVHHAVCDMSRGNYSCK